MDFGDILNEWDRQTTRAAGKRPSVKKTQSEVNFASAPGKPNVLNAWLNKYGVYDRDSEEAENREASCERRRRLLRKKPDAVLDLHGLTRDEAWTVLGAFFENCRRLGFEKVLVIHGKGLHSAGDAVLKEVSRKFIESCPFAGESGHSSASGGGSGSTWVLLKELRE
jgi:DNA-nicking Smr family endonuclease